MKRLPPVDKDKLRAKIRQLDDARLFGLVDRAIELLPPTKLCKWVAPYFSTEGLAPDEVEEEIKADVLRAAKEFQRQSLAGEYYQSFMVNSKNCMAKSRKTTAWITDINRLFEQCCQQTSGTDHTEVREAFEILFELLFAIDQDPDAIVFFADEGGSWQVKTGAECGGMWNVKR